MPRLPNILRPHEWIGLAAGLALAGIIYAALIHPSLRLVGLEEEAGVRRNAAEKELAQLRTEYQQLQTRIGDHQRRLKELGGSPPLASQKDRQIALVTSLAKDNAVKVDQYSPIETVDQEDHQAVLLQFAGRATFAGLHQYFQRVESDVDFVDITHFTIVRLQKDVENDCQVSWSVRINGVRPSEPGTPSPDKKLVAERIDRGGEGG